MNDLLLIGIIITPIILTTLLKSNASYIFLSICMGFVLSSFVSNNPTINSLYNSSINISGNSNSNIQIILILLPAIITMVIFIKTIPKSKLILNLATALACGFLLALILTPLLPSGLQSGIMSSTTWSQIKKFQDIIIGSSAIYVLVVLALSRQGGHSKSHHSLKHK